jgi:hypothetical protein
MTNPTALTIHDIAYLRQASHKAGALSVPAAIAKRLLSGGLVSHDARKDCLFITPRGRLALTRLG